MDTEDMADLNRKLETTDAMVWAEEWCKIATKIAIREQILGRLVDEGWMVGWFANAIERGRKTAGYHQAMSESGGQIRWVSAACATSKPLLSSTMLLPVVITLTKSCVVPSVASLCSGDRTPTR
jgi:hypothetical protein